MSLKGKAIPVTGRGGPDGCETLRLPHSLDNRLTDGGKLSALRADRPLPPMKIPGTHFYQRLSRPQAHNAAGRIRKYSDVIGNRTRDTSACSIVFQPTTLPCDSQNMSFVYQKFKELFLILF
jgi:hypothetical protein